MTLLERVLEVIKQSGITASDFGRKIGATRQAIANWKAGSHPVPDRYLIRIIEVFPEVDARWLITGDHQGKTRELLEQEEYHLLVQTMKQEIIDLQKSLNETSSKLLTEKDEVKQLQRELINTLNKGK